MTDCTDSALIAAYTDGRADEVETAKNDTAAVDLVVIQAALLEAQRLAELSPTP